MTICGSDKELLKYFRDILAALPIILMSFLCKSSLAFCENIFELVSKTSHASVRRFLDIF